MRQERKLTNHRHRHHRRIDLPRFLNVIAALALGITTLPLASQEEAQTVEDQAPQPAVPTNNDFRVAVVDVQKIFREYYKTAEAQTLISAERGLIQKGDRQRATQVAEINRIFREKIAQIRQPDLDSSQKLQLEAEIKQLSDTLQQAQLTRRQIHQQQTRDLDQQMDQRMSGILQEIKSLAESHAKEAGFHLVYDSSGRNSNIVPGVVYAGKTEDITAVLLKELNKSAPQPR